jgi:group II intron reverse transcriptase/maturase
MEEITIESILHRLNMLKAYHQVVGNHGAAGIDKMPVEKLGEYLRAEWDNIKHSIENGSYRPQAVRRVAIPKPNGGVRKLGIPTVLDRMIQQTIAQELSRYYEPKFSDYSYGFREGRSCHQAIDKALTYLNEGHEYVVVIDISKFFDRVNHDKLMYSLSKEISDKRVLKLIRKYLQSGVMSNGVKEPTKEGTPQGGNLSPVLSNIVLDRLDKELEKRGHKFVRYADDISIYVKSQRAGERVLSSITDWIVKQLKLQINEEKSGVMKYHKVELLGFGFYKNSKKVITSRITSTSYARFKRKLKGLTKRSKSMNHRKRVAKINQVAIGWLAYFAKADGKTKIRRIDEWLRHRLRCCIWKQWKLVRTRMRNLQRLGVSEDQAYQWANTRKGYWRISASPIIQRTITTKRLKQSGYKSLEEIYIRLHGNLSNRRDTRTVRPVV